jgi:hypothetical protein
MFLATEKRSGDVTGTASEWSVRRPVGRVVEANAQSTFPPPGLCDCWLAAMSPGLERD